MESKEGAYLKIFAEDWLSRKSRLGRKCSRFSDEIIEENRRCSYRNSVATLALGLDDDFFYRTLRIIIPTYALSLHQPSLEHLSLLTSLNAPVPQTDLSLISLLDPDEKQRSFIFFLKVLKISPVSFIK